MLVVVDPMVVLLDWPLSPDAVFEAEVDMESSVPPHALNATTRNTTITRTAIDPSRVWRFGKAAMLALSHSARGCRVHERDCVLVKRAHVVFETIQWYKKPSHNLVHASRS